MTADPLEWVDVVNEHNVVVGQVTKAEAHEKGLLHRTVIAELLNSNGEWLLVKQSSDRQDAGKYVSPVGGHVRAGEQVVDALMRETREELGIVVSKSSYVGKAIYNRRTLGRTENHLFIVYELHSDDPIQLNNESESYRWVSREELRRMIAIENETCGAALLFVIGTFYPELLP